MAVNFNDSTCGFFEKEVVKFINKQILRNGVNSNLHKMKMCKTWGDMEKKLGDILRDSTVSGAVKESCAWSALALAVGFAQREKREHSEKVKTFQSLLEEQKLFTDVLVGMVNRLRESKERERQKAKLQHQQNLEALQGAEEECSLLRNQLLKVLNTQSKMQEVLQEEKKNEAGQPLSICAVSNPVVRYSTGERAMTGSVQETAVIPATPTSTPTAPAGEANEEKMISVGGDNQNVTLFPSSDISGSSCTQSSSLLPINSPETSCSLLPTHPIPVRGASTEALEIPRVEGNRHRWKGKHCQSKKFFPQRFKPRAGLSPAVRCIRQIENDWICDLCNSVNFSWRNKCFKCKKFPSDKKKEDQ